MEEPGGEDIFEEIWGTMKKGLRKRIQRNMRNLTVSEVYSEPRVAAKAQKMGLQQGSSFDLKTGYDFTKPADRNSCFRKIVQEDPELLVVCPPCGPFSCLQNLNYSKMEQSRAIALLGEGLEHLSFAMKLYEWQVRRGRWAIFEHPANSRGWKEPCVERVLALDGVERVRGDQCQYGLQVGPDGGPSKKPTDFMVNGKHMAKRLSMRCQGGHTHVPPMNGRAKQAERYPEKLCEAMVRGFKEDVREGCSSVYAFDLEDALDQEVTRHDEEQDDQSPEVLRGSGGDDEVESEEEVEEGLPRRVTESDKRKIRRLHNNLGHPSAQSFMRALRVARARPEVVKFVKEEFRYDICEAHVQPKAARPSILPRHFAPGKVIGVDVVFMPSNNPRHTIPVLNVTDWATCYQALEPLEGRLSETIWKGFMRSWVRTFGMPEMVVCDQGREFMNSFCRRVDESGAIIRTIGARSPWQQGRTERHGGLAKGMLKKVVEQIGPSNYDEWVTCVYEVESAKNRMFNRSGYSPAQRQIGMNVRIPGSMASDDPFDAVSQRSTASADIQRLLSIREAAQEAFVKHATQESIKRASRARPRVVRDFSAGEAVFVYRKPLPRKGGGPTGRTATWCGPGTVVMQEGPNLWIAMRGEMWKCAKEQVRSATPEENEAYGLLKDEFKELQAELGRKGSKRAFKDISNWDVPPSHGEEEGGEDDQRPPSQRPRLHEGDGREEEEQEQPSRPYPNQGNSRSSSSSSTSMGDNAEEEEGKNIASPHSRAVAAPQPPEEVMRRAAQSVMRNERLDGTPLQGYHPTRNKLENIRFAPYDSSLWSVTEEETDDLEKNDEWVFHEESRITYIDTHPQYRKKRRFLSTRQIGVPTASKVSPNQSNDLSAVPRRKSEAERSKLEETEGGART